MIQQKIPKKIKGARKKRRIKEKEGQKRVMDDVEKHMRAMIDLMEVGKVKNQDFEGGNV